MYGVSSLSNASPRSNISQNRLPTRLPNVSCSTSIFHQRWWLDAVAPSAWSEATVSHGGKTIGRFPYFESSVFGFRVLGMPPLTRTLGPWIDSGSGKPVAQRDHDRRITTELIAQLPKHTFFRQLLAPGFDNLLAFQSAGFCIGVEHLVEIDGRAGREYLWNNLHHKTRSLIRRADQHQAFEILNDPEEFYRFYQRNLAMKQKSVDFKAADFLAVYRACQRWVACTILAMRNHNAELTAAIFLVWWEGRMHFLLQTRAPSVALAGSIECLIWHAIEIAAKHSLILDLDGIPNEKTAHRLLSFGGTVQLRAILTRGSPLCMAARQLKKSLSWTLNERSAAFC